MVCFFQVANDIAKKYKSLQAQLKEITGLYEEEQRSRDEQHDLLTRAEKKANDLSREIEELKASVEQVCMITIIVIIIIIIIILEDLNQYTCMQIIIIT